MLKFNTEPRCVSPRRIIPLGSVKSLEKMYSPFGTTNTFLKPGSAFLNNCVAAVSNAVTLSVDPSPTAPKSITLTSISSILLWNPRGTLRVIEVSLEANW